MNIDLKKVKNNGLLLRKDNMKDDLILNDGNVTLRRLKNIESDYKLLEKWYQEEEVYSHFEQRILNYEEIVKKYYPRTLKDAKVPVYMIEYDQVPVGIIQYQLINKENQALYKIKNINSYEVDIFIGELNLHNKGIGKKSVESMSNYLFKEKSAELVVMCPLRDNLNAIKCYEKVGFKIDGEFATEDTIGNIQNYVLMSLENNDRSTS
jgi:RimJ/RimL family protein N-acetyltransferase